MSGMNKTDADGVQTTNKPDNGPAKQALAVEQNMALNPVQTS
jgi:hypothetical protein